DRNVALGRGRAGARRGICRREARVYICRGERINQPRVVGRDRGRLRRRYRGVVVAIREIADSGFDEAALLELLRDSVDSGASIGFLAPLPAEEGREFWRACRSNRRRSCMSAWAMCAPASCRTMRKVPAAALIRQ